MTLLAPRPLEFVVKTPLVVGAFIVSGWSPLFSSTRSWPELVVAVLVFELGFYQGRYLINDTIERELDQSHPAAQGRGRLVGLHRISSKWLVAVGATRITLATAVAVAWVRADALTAAIVVAAGVALIYERLRGQIRRQPDPSAQPNRPVIIHWQVYATVGLGYAIRVALGVALAGQDDAEVLLGSAGFGWAFGVMFVTMTWALEASTLLGDHVPAEVASRKSHVAALALYARRDLRYDASTPVLQPAAALSAPWVCSTILAAAAAGWLGWALVGPSSSAGSLLAVALAALSGIATTRAASWVGMCLPAVGASAAIMAIAVREGVARPWLAVVPLLVLLVTHVVFRRLRATDIGLAPDSASAKTS